MRKIAMLIAFVFTISILGCATIPIESKSEKAVSLTGGRDVVVKDFVIQKQGFWIFWGIIPVTRPKIDNIIKDQAGDHAGVQNLKITVKHSLSDYILTLLTASFIYSKTFIIEGQVYD